jgi:hypothetical protein
MDHLTTLMRRTGYDLKVFQAILFNTRAYQRAASAVDVNPGDPYYFPGPLLRRLGAEEVWDSLLTLVVPDLDDRTSHEADSLYAYYDQFKAKTPAEIWAMISASADELAQRQTIQKQIKAMVKAAGNREAAEANPDFQKLVQEQRELKQGEKNDLKPNRKPNPREDQDPRWQGFSADLMRASELPSPAPPGHLLRDFGQSDRLLIENANANASVTQALNLLNGFVDEEVLRQHAQLVRTLDGQTTPEAKVRAAFICILCREPTAQESAWALSEWSNTPAPTAEDDSPVADAVQASVSPAILAVGTRGQRKDKGRGNPGPGIPKATADVLWSLINTDEFLFEQ